MKRIFTSDLEDYGGKKVLLKGWLHNLRELGDTLVFPNWGDIKKDRVDVF